MFSFREMHFPVVVFEQCHWSPHRKHFLILLWVSAGYLVQFGHGRAVSRSPPRFAWFSERIFPYPRIEDGKREADVEEGPLSV
jgi:hypothetical protein